MNCVTPTHWLSMPSQTELVWAEEVMVNLEKKGYEVRLKKVKKPAKTPFGTIRGVRWVVEFRSITHMDGDTQ